MDIENNTHNHLVWLDSIGSATFVINTDHMVIYWNEACEVMTGVTANRVIDTNQHWRGFYNNERPCLADMVLDDGWEEKAELYEYIEVAKTSKRGLIARNWCQTPAGNKFLIFEANAIYDKNKKITGVIETLSDATHLKNLEEKLQVFSRAIANSSSSIVIQKMDGTIEFVNPKFLSTTGYTYDELIGENISLVRADDSFKYIEIHKDLVASSEWKGELLCKRKCGELFWERSSLSTVLDDSGNILHVVGVHEDVTEQHELSEKNSYEAAHDQLTGLFNRREFERRTELLLINKCEASRSHSLCFIDLDQFKVVNDTCGHAAGDELLKQISRMFNEKVRKNDSIARVGGDEFTILMENCELEHSTRVAESLITAAQNFRFAWEGNSFKIGFSVGLVEFTNELESLTELLRQADSACYMAKELGRNRLHVYTQDDKELMKRHGEIQWVTKIQNALDNNDFYLDAQLIKPLRDNNKDHYELLIRMKDEGGNSIAPGAFLPSAERYSLITNIDRWVVNEAFELVGKNELFQQGIEFISINLSGQSLVNEEFHEFLVSKFEESKMPGEKICFEITETSAITHIDKARALIFSLKKYGCTFALDDFGSGLSSFSYLKNLPVDFLKIDGIFIRDIVDDPIDYELVKSINEVAHILNMKTIAEYVENDEIKSLLESAGIDYVQGFGIGKPVDFEQMLEHKEE